MQCQCLSGKINTHKIYEIDKQHNKTIKYVSQTLWTREKGREKEGSAERIRIIIYVYVYVYVR